MACVYGIFPCLTRLWLVFSPGVSTEGPTSAENKVYGSSRTFGNSTSMLIFLIGGPTLVASDVAAMEDSWMDLGLRPQPSSPL